MLAPDTLPALQSAIANAKLDGWLLYDFRGVNRIACAMAGQDGTASRRWLVFIPKSGAPTAITHGIEQGPWAAWPSSWTKEVYSSWRALEAMLATLVGGKQIAMEYSPGDAVPYLDRVPAGVLEMIRAAGATVESSGELVSTFYAAWADEGLASHRRAAEAIAQVAKDAFAHAAKTVRAGTTLTEYDLQQWIRGRFDAAGLETDHGPNVSVARNASNPHYEPTAAQSATITDGGVVLIDLWAKERAPGAIYADQTWMASLGAPSAKALEIWSAIRDARDAAIAFVRGRLQAGDPPRGAEVDRAARTVIVERGYGERFIHRLGHSIDVRELHGSGPNLDDLESRDERLLIPGVGFSIEPGIYIPGEIGMRTEVNAIARDGDVEITPRDIQRELIVV